MKILELTRAFYPSVGGLEKYVADRLKIYESLNIDFKLISTDFSSGKRDITLARGDTTFLKQYSSYNYTPGLKKYLAEDYDILSVNLLGRYYSDYAIRFAKKLNRKIILTPHFTFHTDRYGLAKKIFSRFVFPGLLEKIDRMICFTEFEAEFWRSNYPAVKNKIRIIPHYFDPGEINPGAVKNISKYLLYLGRAEKNKKTGLLIKAFSKIKNPELWLHLTLDKNELDTETRSIVEKDERIKLTGYISDEKKKELLAGCLALILPTSYEAFGIVTLEASAAKKPILCSDIPVLKEILDQEGVIYFSNDEDSVYKSITEFDGKDEESLKRMGGVNYKNLDRYRFEKIKSEFENMLDEMAG